MGFKEKHGQEKLKIDLFCKMLILCLSFAILEAIVCFKRRESLSSKVSRTSDDA